MALRRWLRPRHRPEARTARLEFIALLAAPRIDAAIERARAELDDDGAWEPLEVEVRARATDGGWLEAALGGRAAHGLSLRDPQERHEAESCRRYALLAATLPDSPSLGTLEAATSLLRALALEGDLLLALDGATARWWSPGELAALEGDRPFDLDEHIRIVVEAVERRPGVGHLVRSRGLVKFARPDIAARAPRREAERVSEIVRDVARLLAEGELLLPGDRLAIAMAPPVTLIPRSDDCLADATGADAPLYELRDRDEGGGASDRCDRLIAALKPKPRLKVLR